MLYVPLTAYCLWNKPEMENNKQYSSPSLIGFVFPSASAIVLNSVSSRSSCIGSLKIAHEDELRNVGYIQLEGNRNSYPNIRRGYPVIRRDTISNVEIFGNCCWELYVDSKFKGEKQHVSPGGSTIYLDFQPLSIKRLECNA